GGDLHRSIDGPRPCPDPNRLDHPGVLSDDMERTCRTTGHSASATRITLRPTGRTMKESAFHRPSRSGIHPRRSCPGSGLRHGHAVVRTRISRTELAVVGEVGWS